MMLDSNSLLCLFLTIITTQAQLTFPPICDSSCPQEGLLVEKLVKLSTALDNITISLIAVFDLIDEQCPCVDPSSDCFETPVSTFTTSLEELIDDINNVTDSAPTDCPDRTGAVLVATCDGTGVSVVDPNGFIQKGFNTDTNVTGWDVYINGDTFGIDYIRNDPFEVRCRPTPDGIEVVLGDSGDDPLTMSAVGTGIAIDPDTGKDYVAISFDNETLNGIYCFNNTVFPRITFLFGYDGVPERIKLDDGFVYLNDGQKVVRRLLDGTDDWAEVIFHSTNIKSFAVTDDGQVVFTDTSGAVYIYLGQQTYRQLKRPTRDGTCGFDSAVNPCNSLLYVANVYDANLEIYNVTIFERVGTLTYTESTPSPCPSIAFDPTFCCGGA